MNTKWQNLHDLLRQMWMVEPYRNSASSTGRCVLSACTNMVPMIKRTIWEKMISPTVNQKYSGKCKRGAEILTIGNLRYRVACKCTSVTSYPVKMYSITYSKKNYHSIACSSPSESSHLYLHACYRSLPARGPLIDSCDCVTSLHVHWPIKTPRPSCANQDAWAVVMLKLPEGKFY